MDEMHIVVYMHLFLVTGRMWNEKSNRLFLVLYRIRNVAYVGDFQCICWILTDMYLYVFGILLVLLLKE